MAVHAVLFIGGASWLSGRAAQVLVALGVDVAPLAESIGIEIRTGFVAESARAEALAEFRLPIADRVDGGVGNSTA